MPARYPSSSVQAAVAYVRVTQIKVWPGRLISVEIIIEALGLDRIA